MKELLSMVIAIALIGLTALLAWIIAKVMNYCSERYYAKLHKKHPKLYEMCAERDALTEKRHKEWQERYLDLKLEIDRTLEMMPYLTKAKQEEEEKRLEGLRQIIEEYLREVDLIKKQIEELQERIDEYARINKLKNF